MSDSQNSKAAQAFLAESLKPTVGGHQRRRGTCVGRARPHREARLGGRPAAALGPLVLRLRHVALAGAGGALRSPAVVVRLWLARTTEGDPTWGFQAHTCRYVCSAVPEASDRHSQSYILSPNKHLVIPCSTALGSTALFGLTGSAPSSRPIWHRHSKVIDFEATAPPPQLNEYNLRPKLSCYSPASRRQRLGLAPLLQRAAGTAAQAVARRASGRLTCRRAAWRSPPPPFPAAAGWTARWRCRTASAALSFPSMSPMHQCLQCTHRVDSNLQTSVLNDESAITNQRENCHFLST
jgi:hypothetical protein